MGVWRIRLLLAVAGIALLAAAGLVYESGSEARDAVRFPPPGTLVDIGGRHLHLLCKGSGEPAVVMVAGGGTPAVVSYVLQNRIARFARVCSYDRAGLGWSDAASRVLSFDDQVDDLDRVLRAGHVPGPYVFVPESFGSLIVLDFAARHPDRTAGIVFVDGVDPQLWFPAMVEQSGVSADAKNALTGAAWHLGLVRLGFAKLAPDWVWRLPPEIRGEMIALYSRPSPGYAEALEAYRITPVSRRPFLPPGALGDRPIAVLYHGKVSDALSDQFERGWLASQQRLTHLSRRGQAMMVPNADHELAQEEPDRAANAVRIVLNELHR
ncbi:MAG TPA: alpha/beta hydrolase [Rhizomicrobium sp.]|jgi:pimeloyl-ACP methyl ester carboxylesterase